MHKKSAPHTKKQPHHPPSGGKRKLTAVCSHQTRIGNLDAHLI
ncbi:hypothetical protein HMPREF9348_05447 [Escherichia coli MS 145-7]|nr:hypothetical protein HMPREF9348_05447 [Escherichia coli MS 145-7]